MDQSHYLYHGTIFSFTDALNSVFVKRHYNSQKDILFSFLHALSELFFRWNKKNITWHLILSLFDLIFEEIEAKCVILVCIHWKQKIIWQIQLKRFIDEKTIKIHRISFEVIKKLSPMMYNYGFIETYLVDVSNFM